ncbi:type II/IV secretion system protein [Candidatus Gottesmanbacteria bacterium]|nr:type II/IV secretion system protein [Candidatus Gottesmanbacteria bacterium]
MPTTAQELLTILVSDGHMSQEEADAIRLESLNSGTPVEAILTKRQVVSEDTLTQGRAKALNIPFVKLEGKAISPDVITYIPEPVVRRYVIIPFAYDNTSKILSVAMLDPLDFQVIEFLEKKTGKSIKPFMATREDIMTHVEELYNQNLGADVSAALKETTPSAVKTYEAGKLGEVIREAPIAQIVSAILEQAMRIRASDIHIEPQIADTRVRYRVDGILQERLALPRGLQDAVVSRIKILSDMKIDEKRVPQDGRFNFKMGDNEVDLRVSTLPTVHGEKVVMRLLKKSGGIPTMQELGLRGLALKNLEMSITRPHGIILVIGPTGSGKTTTLYAVLAKLNNTRVNIMTLEDPVEYEIGGVNQVQINPAAGLTFATGLRSFLRQDPNIILVGEIRDTETTDLAIQAALTGHLVFSTLHTNNARTCQVEYEPEAAVGDDIRKVLGNLLPADKKIILYHGNDTLNSQSCQACGGSGYLGRLGIFEVFPVSDAISKLILERTPMAQIEKLAVAEGMITMKQDGYLKALEGMTTLEEVLRVAQD